MVIYIPSIGYHTWSIEFLHGYVLTIHQPLLQFMASLALASYLILSKYNLLHMARFVASFRKRLHIGDAKPPSN